MRQSSIRAATMAVAGLLVTAAFARDASSAQPAPDPKVAELIHELGLVESPTALRDQPGWKAPKKIVLTSLGAVDALQSAAPGVKFVVVNSPEEMAAQAIDADAIA